MKTRIRVETMGDGSKVYYPQRKTFLIWDYFYDWLDQGKGFYTEEKAKSFIDDEIKKWNSNRVVSVTYIKEGNANNL